MKTLLRTLLLLLFTGYLLPIWAEQHAPKTNALSLDIKNGSIQELSTSVLDSLMFTAVVIHARMTQQQRDVIIKGIKSLDKQVGLYVYPASVYKVISDEETRKKIQLANASKLFNGFDVSAQRLYKSSSNCLNEMGLQTHKIIGSPIEDTKKKHITFVFQFGSCGRTQVELTDITNIDGHYYFGGINTSVTKTQGIAFQYELAGLFKSGVAPAKKNGLWGLIDTKGGWLVSPKYLDMGRLEEGILAVSKVENKFAFMNASGKLLTEFKYTKAHYFSDGLAGVKVSKKWGFIDKAGVVKVPAIYTNIRNFNKGFAPVRLNKKWGYINKQGKWLVKPIYDAAYSFTDDGLAVVVVKNKRGFINTKGRFAIKPVYRRVQRFSGGIAPISKEKGSWSFIDVKNKALFPNHFSEARIFSEGKMAVMNGKDQWGYIDKTGKLQIPYQFEKGYDFKEGFALVRKNNKRGFVNQQGEITVPMIYEDAFRFSEGLAPVKKEGLWGYIPKPAE